MRDPKKQNQPREAGEPGLSSRWGFPPRPNSWGQELFPRERGGRARSRSRLCGTRQEGAHLLVEPSAPPRSGLGRTKVPLLRS